MAEVTEGGRVRSNRAVNIDPPPVLPPLTSEDREAIAVGAAPACTTQVDDGDRREHGSSVGDGLTADLFVY